MRLLSRVFKGNSEYRKLRVNVESYTLRNIRIYVCCHLPVSNRTSLSLSLPRTHRHQETQTAGVCSMIRSQTRVFPISCLLFLLLYSGQCTDVPDYDLEGATLHHLFKLLQPNFPFTFNNIQVEIKLGKK